jgi:uncharacterized protein (TIGR02246 family)
MHQPDVAAILELLSEMKAAWARGDGAGYAAACADDARYVTASGLRIVGRQAIAEAHQRIFDTALSGTHLDIDDPLDVQPIAPSVALVHASGAVRFLAENEQPPRTTGMLTMLAVHDGDAWRFASFTNTPVQPDRAL